MRRVGLTVLAVIWATIGETGCWNASRGSIGLHEMSEIAGVEFPQTTELMHSYHEFGPGQGKYFQARLQIPRRDAEAFLQSLPPGVQDQRRQVTNSAARKRQDWWNPDKEQDAVERSHLRGDGVVFVLVSRGDADVATVYLLWSGG